MNQTLDQALKSADLNHLVPLLIDYADNQIRRYLWRGHSLRGAANDRQFLAEGASADDFVMEAFESLLKGRRTYREDMDLEMNLRRTIESMVWNSKKKSDKQPIAEQSTGVLGGRTIKDSVEEAADPQTQEISEVERKEKRQHQEQLLRDFRKSLEGDPDLRDLFDAMEMGVLKPAEIEDLTGICSKRIYELKRKLKLKLTEFSLNHPAAQALGQ